MNKNIEKLKNSLLPDFFDRISQRIVEFSSLSKINIMDEFYNVWEEMKFKPNIEIKKYTEYIKKIIFFKNRVELPGNYGTLQQIAISIHDYLNSEILQKSEPSLINHIRNEYRKRFPESVITVDIKINNTDKSGQKKIQSN